MQLCIICCSRLNVLTGWVGNSNLQAAMLFSVTLGSTMVKREWLKQDWEEADVGLWWTTVKVLADSPWVFTFLHWLVTEWRLSQGSSLILNNVTLFRWGQSLGRKQIQSGTTYDENLDFTLICPYLHLLCCKIALMQSYLASWVSKLNIPLEVLD